MTLRKRVGEYREDGVLIWERELKGVWREDISRDMGWRGPGGSVGKQGLGDARKGKEGRKRWLTAWLEGNQSGMDWQTGKKGIGSKEDLGGENVDKEQVALYSL